MSDKTKERLIFWPGVAFMACMTILALTFVFQVHDEHSHMINLLERIAYTVKA
jgi:hypothetical protein